MKKISIHTYIIVLAAFVTGFTSCNKNDVPVAAGKSASGKIFRYDLVKNDYDVLPVTTFSLSYQDDLPVNVFEKNTQALFSYSLSYDAAKQLVKAQANNSGTQNIIYDPATKKPKQINYTTLTDTGKVVFTYQSGTGKLISVLDSLKQPLKLPVKYQYLFTYDAAGNNVIQITKNQFDLQNRPTLRQNSYYKFDNNPNPFNNFPTLQSSIKLPGEFAALVNKNNVTEGKMVGVIYSPGGPGSGSEPILTPVDIYQSVWKYEYNDKGLPVKSIETFDNIQFSYKGSRTFTYDY
ncbi:hypothetical protein GCM10023149_08470 [Mucilaginibacter gynuensis]|uniref:YD repeat-containing protein n=1 Tax=Mucilaginibacter gynuensis TaxID=1302236 RepID=A0ABP8FXA0_9SPHI